MGPLIEQAPKDEFDTSSLEKIYQNLVQGDLDLDDVESNDIVIRLTNVVEKFKSELSSASRTGRGMSETTRNLWVGTLHECGAIHESMLKLTKHGLESSEQQCESSESRRKKDTKDFKVLKEQLNQFNPFDLQDLRLQNKFTDISADNNDGVNCDQAEQVRFEIQRSLDNNVINQATIKRSKQVKTLAKFLPATKVNGDTIHADPNVLFQRLIILIDSAEDLTHCFDYKLTPEPTSLFKDRLIRKPNKAQLGRKLVKNCEIL